MADPLFIIVNIITVVGVAEGIDKIIIKIKNFREVPNELLFLINEIANLRIVLCDIEDNLTLNASII